MTQPVACTPVVASLGLAKPIVALPAILATACGCLWVTASPAENGVCQKGEFAAISAENIVSFTGKNGVFQFEVKSGEANGGVCVAEVATEDLPDWIKKKFALL